MNNAHSSTPLRIAIYGAGSLGTVLGAYLTRAGLDVTLINRNQNHVDALNQLGAQISGTVLMTVPVKACTPDQIQGEFDLVFLLTKQLENPMTVARIAPILGSKGVICTLQNGLPEPVIADIVGSERTFGCAVSWGAALLGAARAELTSDPANLSFSIGAVADGQSVWLDTVRAVLQNMGDVEIESDFRGARWSKLLVNCSASGMSAVLGATFGAVVDNRVARTCVQRIMKECLDVARAAKINPQPIQGKNVAKLFDYHGRFKQLLSFQLIPFAIRKHRALKASMLMDLENGRLTEVDFINGVVCALGRQVGVATQSSELKPKAATSAVFLSHVFVGLGSGFARFC